MDAHNLSQRLLTVASFVEEGARLADIGSDHAYLPAYLALNGKLSYAVAGEVVKGPYENAQHVIRKEGLENQVVARLADGLAAITETDEIDTITICGMGGPLIVDILSQDPSKLARHPRLILQPNVGESSVRQWLCQNNYHLENEVILSEDKHTYEILVANYQTGPQMVLTAQELKYGPYLMTEKNSAFVAKWQAKITKLQKVQAQLQKAKEVPTIKMAALTSEIEEIEAMLYG